MTCQHSNPAFHRYCVICGESLARQRCDRCGATSDSKYLFCYACGHSLRSKAITETVAPALPQTYPLEPLLQATAASTSASAVKIEKTSGKVTQDEIKKLLAARKKKS